MVGRPAARSIGVAHWWLRAATGGAPSADDTGNAPGDSLRRPGRTWEIRAFLPRCYRRRKGTHRVASGQPLLRCAAANASVRSELTNTSGRSPEMTTLLDLPEVSECTVEGCSYNHDGSHAAAVTISVSGDHAECATFIPLEIKGGLKTVLARVGARQRANCSSNEELECTATAVHIGQGGDVADCLTFPPR